MVIYPVALNKGSDLAGVFARVLVVREGTDGSR